MNASRNTHTSPHTDTEPPADTGPHTDTEPPTGTRSPADASPPVEIRRLSYGHPDAVRLTGLVQAEYRRRFGYDDFTPLHPSHFDPPQGLFLVAYAADVPVASGGWRAQQADDQGYADGDAELKRMFVLPEARGKGLARRLLATLEESARAAGRTRMVLETGTELPEALALYASSGYTPTAPFGPFRDYAESRFLAKPLHQDAQPPRRDTEPTPRDTEPTPRDTEPLHRAAEPLRQAPPPPHTLSASRTTASAPASLTPEEVTRPASSTQ